MKEYLYVVIDRYPFHYKQICDGNVIWETDFSYRCLVEDDNPANARAKVLIWCVEKGYVKLRQEQ